MRWLSIVIVALSFGAIAAAHAASDATAPINSDAHASVRPVITPENRDVWTMRDDGSIRHVQSGLVCPAAFGASKLWSGDVYPSPERGTDVGCDYGRGVFGQAQSKLTIFAVKAGTGTTIDSAFEKYRGEMHQMYPNGTDAHPSIHMQGTPPADFPELRSEEMDVMRSGHRYKTVVIVFLKSGWVVEIRSTYRTEITAGDSNAAEGFGSDLAGDTAALFQAVTTVGAPK